MTPRVSVLIPNFNNGRSSALDGRRDFLGELSRSLETTLADDPELLEILVADDGSSDDSLETARRWADGIWPDGRRVVRLIELPHSGVLSRVLNRLHAEARGTILARLDGDVVLLTRRWASELAAIFDRDPTIGVVTGVQLLSDGTVHAFGDDLWGPRGYRHVGAGARMDDLPEEREVDHAMGCFHAMRRETQRSVGDYDESILRGQTEEYGVRIRAAGWRVIATRRILFEHWHRERKSRANRADCADRLDDALAYFAAKTGFDRLAPDLAAVRRRYGRTPLWWRDHAARGVAAASDEWTALGRDASLARRVAAEVALARGKRSVVAVGCGCACFCVALARQGSVVEGFEQPGAALDAARRVANACDPATRGRLRLVETPDLERLPLADASRSAIALFGVLERWWNPVGLLRECRRIIAPCGELLVRSRLRPTALDDPNAPGHLFTAEELRTLLRHVGGWREAGFAPRVLAERGGDAWLELSLAPAASAAGRGYFRPVAADTVPA
jgi:glycosyltransferase involved in cell wall biosynthesis/SAM-dependent methyltransferase